jgi:hypothetical protein
MIMYSEEARYFKGSSRFLLNVLSQQAPEGADAAKILRVS